ncbi:unnamed protein product [Dovyalis caffra]|uniref:non-specific serine/threonine protein kinase n=1 Tax=Dovyalis caffra TaxID=77055 RepID=A0AAV1SIH1_9ROSI|nr:unnamed protein product [Dovyalis caffra]
MVEDVKAQARVGFETLKGGVGFGFEALKDWMANSRNTSDITGRNSQPTSLREMTPGSLQQIMSNTTPRISLAQIVAGLTGAGLLTISLVVILIFRVRRWSKSKRTEEDVEVPGMPVRFSYEDLRVATDDFKERLGRGGFGSVFKGVLEDGTIIAVKHLDKQGQGKKAVLEEVETIGNLHHSNLVRLIGFCAEKLYKLLVYEYMSNGSLENWIFQNDKRPGLDWQTRKKIILDIAKGLAYLHEECRQTIIHFDIKPQNILLDPNFNAKVSDFGLSKVIDGETGHFQISMRGTPGYIAPEWCKLPPGSRITPKVDVYSFGIVLLEVVCARKNIEPSLPESDFHLLRMLQNKAEEDRLIDIVENVDECMQSDREEILRMIKVAAWCLQDDPERRPLMSTVVKVFEGVKEIDTNFLVVLPLEIVFARRNEDDSQPETAIHLLIMLQKKGEQDRLADIVETLDNQENMQSDIRK